MQISGVYVYIIYNKVTESTCKIWPNEEGEGRFSVIMLIEFKILNYYFLFIIFNYKFLN